MQSLPETRGRKTAYPEIWGLSQNETTSYNETETLRVRQAISYVQKKHDRQFITRVVDGRIWVQRKA